MGDVMERRRPLAILAVIAVVVAIAFLVYYERVSNTGPSETATATVTPPAESAAPAATTTPATTTEVASAPPAETAAPADAAPAATTAPDSTVATAPPADGAAAVPAITAPADKPADSAVAMTNPSDIAPAANPPAMPGPDTVPTFDVVRVEPTGEAVIAGQAAPEAKVEILDGTTTIATAEANEAGEWAMAVDKPLPPGSHDLALRTTSKDQKTATLSDQRVTVSVPQPGSKDVLVVVNTPDAASKVLQVPDATSAPAATAETTATPPAASGEQVAAAPGADQSSPAAEAKPGEQQVATAEPAAPATGTDTTGEPPAASTADNTAEQPAGGASDEQVATAEPGLPKEPPVATEAPVTGEPQITAEAPVAGEPPVKAEPPIAAETDLAAKEEPAPPAPKPEVTVAAVEADTAGAVYIAGTVKTGETVRVYLNDQPLGEAQPSASGTWLVQTKKDMPAGNYTVRADQVDASGAVVARAEVPFDREVEVAVLKPGGAAGGDTGASLSGAMPEMETVVIKKGDNLWRIARGAWGKGMRWSTIYQANNDQIRNPHWIYPGQVFIMPKGSATWTD